MLNIVQSTPTSDIAEIVAPEVILRTRKNQLISGQDGVGLNDENVNEVIEQAMILARKLEAQQEYVNTKE
jgi:hypothetical protein